VRFFSIDIGPLFSYLYLILKKFQVWLFVKFSAPVDISIQKFRPTNTGQCSKPSQIREEDLSKDDATIVGYFGHHKAGSTWISLITQDICAQSGLKVVVHEGSGRFGGDLERYYKENPFDFLILLNADYTFIRYVNVKGFHVVRDPRDIVVSGYFSHFYSHPDEGWPKLTHYRRYLRTLSKDEGLLREMEFLAGVLYEMISWDYDTATILQLRFEDLIKDPMYHFTKVFRFLEIVPQKASEEELKGILEKYSFEKLSGGRRPGSEDQAHHYRKGTPGDWRNHFNEQHKDYFKKLYNPLLLKLGYEKSENW
jgi:hypothetical protein